MGYTEVKEKYVVSGESLGSVANAIREKTGSPNQYKFPDGFVSAIEGIETEPTLQEKNVTPSTEAQSVTPDEGYDGLSKVDIEAVPVVELSVPSASIANSTGRLTVKVTQEQAGYVEAGTASKTFKLTTKVAETFVPGQNDQIISKYCWLIGDQTIKGDENLLPENIVPGVSIFGVAGTAETGGDDGEELRQLVNRSITTLDDDAIETVGPYAFYSCKELQSVNLPNTTSIKSSAFLGCSALTYLNVPKLAAIEAACFSGNAFESFTIDQKVTIYGRAFENNKALKWFEITGALYTSKSIYVNAFNGCSALKTLIVRNTNFMSTSLPIINIVSTNVFNGTPFASGGTGGKVFVGSRFVETYKAATNWSTLYAAGTCVFYPLEEYTKDGTAKGELDWDKINALDEGGAGE